MALVNTGLRYLFNLLKIHKKYKDFCLCNSYYFRLLCNYCYVMSGVINTDGFAKVLMAIVLVALPENFKEFMYLISSSGIMVHIKSVIRNYSSNGIHKVWHWIWWYCTVWHCWLYCKCSVSCQFSDIGSLDQLSNEQKRSISDQNRPVSKQTRSFVRNVP